MRSITDSLSSLKWILRSFFALLISVIITSCNESKDLGPDALGYEFYPLIVGQYRVYDVEEIRYLVSGFDTTTYQLKETIFDSIQSIDQTSYLLRRDIRVNAMSNWESDSVWIVTRTSSYLSITENNIPFIKLTFPVTEGREWDGNSLNSRSELTYYYQSAADPIIDSIGSENHIRLIIEDIEENVTGVDLRSEVYVEGVGLVEKDYLTQKKCTSSDCGADFGEVIGGRSLKQTLIETGNEE
ncbi:hypothetical protein [Ekhidna sp. To15]|uniref:hypothetical protein n=1 Tax=Ekhidna sp. To15 TaxID=3395267 RepID=UPI003F5242C2